MLGHYAELIRIRKPAGFLLFLWPSLWGLTMSAYRYHLPVTAYLTLLLKTAIAAFIIRSCGCIINDILDREVDVSSESTNKGPIASGDISVFAATLFLLAQFAVGITMFSTFRSDAYHLMVMHMIPVLCFYPMLKRSTRWPQAWLGLTINLGFVWAWLSIADISIILLDDTLYTNIYMMGALWCWTMLYDTIYGCQNEDDDLSVAVGSNATVFGDEVIPTTICFAVVMVGLLYASGVSNSHGNPYFVICVGGTSAFFLWKFATLDVNSEHSCWSFFIHNALYLGFVVYAGILVDYIRVIVRW
ncbi:UbiA prenyltransferase [Schizopora paradoxa]|uniref:UbiA prenyltransferase n=1 Tax=Schizopora paradoxa TaxID=27342 RepID=A0A0H2RUS0_9AGAM|nr:UbiA prenyltransferase [Schizopora paradoxa]